MANDTNCDEVWVPGTVVRCGNGDTSFSGYVVDGAKNHTSGKYQYLIASVEGAGHEQRVFRYTVRDGGSIRGCHEDELFEFEEAIADLESVVRQAESAGESDQREVVRIGDWVGVCVSEGEPSENPDLVKEVILMRRRGDLSVVFARMGMGTKKLVRGYLPDTQHLKDCLAYATRGLALCRGGFRKERSVGDKREYRVRETSPTIVLRGDPSRDKSIVHNRLVKRLGLRSLDTELILRGLGVMWGNSSSTELASNDVENDVKKVIAQLPRPPDEWESDIAYDGADTLRSNERVGSAIDAVFGGMSLKGAVISHNYPVARDWEQGGAVVVDMKRRSGMSVVSWPADPTSDDVDLVAREVWTNSGETRLRVIREPDPIVLARGSVDRLYELVIEGITAQMIALDSADDKALSRY